MAHDWDAEFEALADELPQYYPGSTRAIIRHPNRPEAAERRTAPGVNPEWDAKPRIFDVGNGPQEFFTIGNLAAALGRKAGTLRAWERKGILPEAIFQSAGAGGDLRGRRRYYSREQVAGIVQIAQEEGLLSAQPKPFEQTRFTDRVVALFISTNPKADSE